MDAPCGAAAALGVADDPADSVAGGDGSSAGQASTRFERDSGGTFNYRRPDWRKPSDEFLDFLEDHGQPIEP